MEILITIIVVCVIMIYTYSNIKTNKEEEKKEDTTNNLLLSYKEVLLNIMKDIIENDINMCNIHNEEELLEVLLISIKDRFINTLIQEESDKVLIILEEYIIDEYISNVFVENYDISKIYHNNKIKHNIKENKYDEELGIDIVSNHIKSDSSTIDITEDLNGIFFGEI